MGFIFCRKGRADGEHGLVLQHMSVRTRREMAAHADEHHSERFGRRGRGEYASRLDGFVRECTMTVFGKGPYVAAGADVV